MGVMPHMPESMGDFGLQSASRGLSEGFMSTTSSQDDIAERLAFICVLAKTNNHVNGSLWPQKEVFRGDEDDLTK